MKHAIPLLLLSCVLVAQDKPATETPKPAAIKKPDDAKPKIPPVDLRDELIELIHKLKKESARSPQSPSRFGTTNSALAGLLAAQYDAEMRAKTEAQRLLLQALIELAKDSEKTNSRTFYHSSNPPAIIPDPY